MHWNIDSMYESSKMLLDYISQYRGYNAFLIDELNESDVRLLRNAVLKDDKVTAVKYYLKLDKQIDEIRDSHCYNNKDLPYRSSFRSIAKDLFRFLKDSWLIYSDDFHDIAFIMRFISTSDYYVIREFLIRRSRSFFMYRDIPLDPDEFYCGYIPIEAIMDYCVKMCSSVLRDNFKG